MAKENTFKTLLLREEHDFKESDDTPD